MSRFQSLLMAQPEEESPVDPWEPVSAKRHPQCLIVIAFLHDLNLKTLKHHRSVNCGSLSDVYYNT